jgi:N-acetylmuramoyl-L-alanine amidase
VNIVSVAYPTPGDMSPRQLVAITDEIIHHSAGNPNQTPLEIDAEHRARGMAMIGYNYVIAWDGTVYAGRPVGFVPAAAYGRNTESINICVLGNFQGDDPGYTGEPTKFQLGSLMNLSLYLHHQFPSIVRTIGHRDVATFFYPNNESNYSTACPGEDLYKQLGTVRAYVTEHLSKL